MIDIESHVPKSPVSRSVAGTRLLVGLLQGLALFLIYQAGENKLWTADNSGLFAALLLALTIGPVLLVSGLGHMPPKTLWRWLLPVAAVLALLGFYDIWRSAGAPYWDYQKSADLARFPSPQLWLHAVAGFFIAHSMVSAAVMDGRRIAGYRAIFESASKLLIQVAFAGVFVGIVWLVLVLGAELFKLVKLGFLKNLLDESWFAIPVTTFAFAYALHITDVRPAIVSGIRGLVLVLLSWILPIAVLIIGGFLLTLPFTGLQALWATKSATALLLAASALLVVLINAAFQDGSVAHEVATPIRISARIAAVLLMPLTLIAAYALNLRVGQYGWTVDRLVAAFCLVVAVSCAAGYFWAAIRSREWLSRVAPVNVLTAFILLFLLLAIFSPLLDPARISVNSQLAHLKAGKVSADTFDYEYLRFSGKRFGRAALKSLATQTTGKDADIIRMRAAAALAKDKEYGAMPEKLSSAMLAGNITVWPEGKALPDSFLAQDWKQAIGDERWKYPQCLQNSGERCDAFLVDIDADGALDVALQNKSPVLHLFRQVGGVWRAAGTVAWRPECTQTAESLKRGDIRTLAPELQDVAIGGIRYRINSNDNAVVKTGCSE
jgi:Domain of unknown function (DUF4153)